MFTHINDLPTCYYVDNHVSAFQRRFQCQGWGWNRKNSFCVRLSGTKCAEELRDYISSTYKIETIVVNEGITNYKKGKKKRNKEITYEI
ncbi:MAG: hypothetical protein WD512_14310 [Candidatus Paceibacterota bacterium]